MGVLHQPARVDPTTVNDPHAFLARVVTNLAVDRLRRIKAQHEEYIGPWLPEPIMTQPDPVERAAARGLSSKLTDDAAENAAVELESVARAGVPVAGRAGFSARCARM